jgi:hypothetical protein
MTNSPEILLLDDGELEDVARVLDELELSYTRLRGGEIADRVAPPTELLVATPRRAERVRRGSPSGAQLGRPVRIIAVSEDSTAMRRMLRRMGYHLLVRLPSHDSIWRLLIRRAIYQGTERRRDDRIAVGSNVAISSDQSDDAAVLMDISNRGCRLVSTKPFGHGTQLSIELPARTTGGSLLRISGHLVRVSNDCADEGYGGHTAAMIFDSDLSEEQRVQLGAVINKWSMGVSSIAPLQGQAPELPPCESGAIPGLTLDDETDPAIQIGEQVALHVEAQAGARSSRAGDRRSRPRGAFMGPVVALGRESHRVLMGRDLSAGGMRVERLPDLAVGDSFRLALHGSARNEPYLIQATVVRDDGDDGLALEFEKLDPTTCEALEKLVACLPDVESLEEGEARGLGAVISEILDDE